MKPQTHCKVCMAILPAPFLSLGMQPLANAVRSPNDESPEFTAPLAVTQCHYCGLIQLTVVVDPNLMFNADYPFASGVSQVWKDHCEQLAESFPAKRVLDIAANDGTALIPFAARGAKVLGIDPASKPRDDIELWPEFWSVRAAERALEALGGPPDLIIAQNVLGHVADPCGFLSAAASILEAGRMVVEVPDAEWMVRDCAFDTIYHEHLSYWSESSLKEACSFAGLCVEKIEEFPNLHGGTKRYWLKRGPQDRIGVLRPSGDSVRAFADEVERRLERIAKMLYENRRHLTGAIGASAKGAVMLNALKARGVQDFPSCIVDETPAKQGKVLAGVRIPIEPPEKAVVESWDRCWVLSPNWKDVLEAKMRGWGFVGEFLDTH